MLNNWYKFTKQLTNKRYNVNNQITIYEKLMKILCIKDISMYQRCIKDVSKMYQKKIYFVINVIKKTTV